MFLAIISDFVLSSGSGTLGRTGCDWLSSRRIACLSLSLAYAYYISLLYLVRLYIVKNHILLAVTLFLSVYQVASLQCVHSFSACIHTDCCIRQVEMNGACLGNEVMCSLLMVHRTAYTGACSCVLNVLKAWPIEAILVGRSQCLLRNYPHPNIMLPFAFLIAIIVKFCWAVQTFNFTTATVPSECGDLIVDWTGGCGVSYYSTPTSICICLTQLYSRRTSAIPAPDNPSTFLIPQLACVDNLNLSVPAWGHDAESECA